jgi:hypothetical protein
MGIREIGPVTEVRPGQWICETPLLRDHICSEPREVVRRSGKRVYFKNRHGEDDGAYCSIRSVLALCDTKEEADTVYAVSKMQFDELNEVRRRHQAHFKALLG